MSAEKEERIQECLNAMALSSYRIRTYMSGFSEPKFLDNPKTQDAVRYNILILGSAAHELMQLKKNLRDEYTDYPAEVALIASIADFDPEDLWEVLKDEFDGVWQHLVKFEKMAVLEAENPSEKNTLAKKNLFALEKTRSQDSESSSLDTNYKYAIKSKKSTWTMKK
jgi:uncharacterized protein with HEPN domain